jgi:pimeloyl-ACP methyl ester carboxylesterase
MTIDVNGARLFHLVSGAGEPLVLVHGSWDDHHAWDAVVPALAARHTIITYDRRGHGLSAATRKPTIHDHVADLAALVDVLAAGPVHLVGNSLGASIALRTAALHPSRFLSLALHEPPLFGTLDRRGPLRPALEALMEAMARVEALLRAGRMADAARTFVDEIALGPGAWEQLPSSARDRVVGNAPTFLAELEDPDTLDLELSTLSAFRGPALITQGGRSPPLFAAAVERVAAALPRATRHTFAGAGHVPHETHPREYLLRLETFLVVAGASSRAP